MTAPQLCPRHQLSDLRGAHAPFLPLPDCARRTEYGVWDEDAGGFVFTADCAIEAGNWAVELRAQDPDANLTVLGVCPEHSEQPATTCADCAAEYDET